MANNTILSAGTADGDTIATDDVGGVKYQRVKLVDGTEDSTAAIPGDAANGLDVDVTRVQGNVAVTGTFWQATQPVSGPLTDTQLRASAVPVSGTFWQATQPVSGPLTDTQLRASAVPVSGPLTDAQLRASTVPISGTVTASGPLTDTQLRASAVPVSGTVTANAGTGTLAVSGPLTDTQLRASAVPVSGTVTANAGTGTLAVSGPLTDTQLRATAVPVSQATLTKGTQGANGVSTQDLKDAGRVALQFYANAVASGTTGTETAISLTKAADTGATSAATSFVITNGKRFRITSISVASRGNATATAQITTFSLRINTAGAVTTTSTPIVFQAASACAAVASAWDRVIIPIPDGYEILGNGTIQFGLTANAVFVTNAPTWFVNITGFEY